MFDTLKLIVLALIVFFAALGADWARDPAYMVHALLIMLVAAGLFFWQLRRMPVEGARPAVSMAPQGYMDGPIRYGVIATAFWGVVGFLVGTFIAFQLAFPRSISNGRSPMRTLAGFARCTPAR